MTFRDDTEALERTIKSLYGDLLDEPLFSALAPSPSAGASEALAAYAEEIRFCQRCVLHIGRKNLVFGRGSPEARIAFIGDVPSSADDKQGSPFSDEAGDLLQKMIVAMKLKPEETYLTNVFKCRPPSGETPGREQFRHCEQHLNEQFRHLQAEYVVALGEIAAKTLARAESPLATLRSQVFDWNGRKVFCTHHPRDLLANPAKKKEAWDDLQAVMRAMGGK